MKLAPLLAEYFYANKRLDLPGIGSFVLDPSGLPEPENPKHNRSALSENIHFENDPGAKESPDLINYIASTSGKIKALASADLESHLELARQFLNIGKPFLFEGIGTLTKLQAGNFSFVPGAIMQERVKEAVIKDSTTSENTNEQGTGFKNIFYARKEKTSKKKTLIILVLLGTLAVALWGGYTIYKKTSSRNNDKAEDAVLEEVVPVNTETAPAPVEVEKKDTLIAPPTVAPGNFRFVVEAADKTRGLQRYSQLRGFGLPVQLSTRDSLHFEIFFILPASAADTAKVRDSLKQLYTPAGARTYVTQ